ncbi:ribonuclease III [Paenibacillus darwinianus]|uniref:Ribonuclease 3 n=1 Tax=Paenibacillus darwinianus TaxID=1380763 RepID=A0A9W5W651_9BACL|nr:ribonuclease III [Paenibacillus darwinianus]EXX85436.1 ribonuclease III [Paenibacillus darwinianus]EXX86290.1 ribonuclease III [Paenibacillus darwinianus]EXX86691.1 ribonuclease III [Paenibacillus darwinianus]
MKHEPFDALQQRLGVCFNRAKLLRQAFTHTSYVNEHKSGSTQDNERLEFLGDAVLQLLVSEYLYLTHPLRPEGELTRMRASIVCEPSFARFAEVLELGKHVLLGRGEEQLGGRQRPALLADLFESFIGAMYLDGGLERVRTFLEGRVFPLIDDEEHLPVKDFKSKLQERAQHRAFGPIEYGIEEERGPAHDREFVIKVSIGGEPWGTGVGRTKKEAEQRAAAEAWRRLSAEEKNEK